MEVITRQKSRVSIAPDRHLPPIFEAPHKTSFLFKTRDFDNPFRKQSRRSSVASAMTSRSDLGLSSSDHSVSLSVRRVSGVEKRNTIDLTKSEKIMKKVELKRRNSMPNMEWNQRKFSFGAIGKRVSTLLKAKNAFSMLRQKSKQFEDDSVEDDKVFEIDSLPSKPRFASTLSIEAQYAMMKGYEDLVYSNLCNQYPEYRQMLRRNRTPMTGITVRNVNGRYGNISEIPRLSEDKGCSDNDVDGNVGDTLDSRDCYDSPSTSISKSEMMCLLSTRDARDPSPIPEFNSTADQSPWDYLNGAPLPYSNYRNAERKTRSLPEIQNTEKQLVMTYRYHRAMDILDNLREHQGLNALSPRVKENRNIEPLKDFNSWSYVWTHEFEPKTANMEKAYIH